MLVLAALDVVAYGLFVRGAQPPTAVYATSQHPLYPGFNAVGAALSTVLFAGLGQCFTAFMSVFVLRRMLTPLQLASLAVILAGLSLRAAPQLLAYPAAGTVATGDWTGLSSLVGSTFFYAVMGVVYEHLLAQKPPPPHSVTMFTISAFGACVSTCARTHAYYHCGAAMYAPTHHRPGMFIGLCVGVDAPSLVGHCVGAHAAGGHAVVAGTAVLVCVWNGV